MKSSLRTRSCLLALSLAGWNISACAESTALAFEHAWIRAMPPGMKMTAGFGTLRNTGSEPIELTAYSSAGFGAVSLHRSETVDGVSRMRAVPTLVVPAGGTVELAPGGYHLMLMKPVAPLESDTPVTITMTTSEGAEFRFDVPVERR